MAARAIAITITVNNQQAVAAVNATQGALAGLGNATDKHTHLQNGLTSSFIKGNLAARAISIAFLTMRDSLGFAIGEAVKFEHNMTKIAAITETGGASLRSLETTIRSLSLATNQNQNELAKAALEMGKMGLTGPQVEEALGGVARLARALDEDLVRTGETVVAVLNAYGFATSEAGRVTDQLAFTVKASALSIESFGVAFSYVGGTAKAAGVDFTELQGAMDVLSNAGIKASTIGTQLRRVIADLSDPASKAGRAIDGQTISSLGLVGALGALREKNIDIAGLTEIFGRTASSVASILTRYTGVIALMAKRTEEANGVTGEMSALMNTTLLSSVQGVKVAWADLGIEISKSAGFLKFFSDTAKAALTNTVEVMQLSNNLKKFEQSPGGKAVQAQRGKLNMTTMGGAPSFESMAVGSKEYTQFLASERQAEIDAKLKENITASLMATFDKNFKLPKNFDDSKLDLIQPKDTAMYKRLEKLYGADKEGFAKAVTIAKGEFALKAELAGDAEFDMSSLDKKTAQKDSPDFDPMDVFDRLQDMGSNGDTYQENFRANRRKKEDKADKKSAKENDMTKEIKSAWEASKDLTLSLTAANAQWQYMQVGIDGVNGSVGLFSHYLSEGILSDKQNPFEGITNAFGDFAKKMTADLISLTIRLLIFKTVLAAFGGGFSLAGGFNFASQGGKGFQDLALSAFGGKLQKNAAGTDEMVRGPKLFLAGEGGVPERVKISSGSRSNESSGGQTFIIQGDVYDYDKFQRKVKQAQETNRKAFV